MSFVINSNIMSLNAQRNLNSSQNTLGVSLQRLSSGLRINSAKDDAAGLAITDRMTSQIRGLDQAVRNANDGISLAQTAEGALQESTNILQRMRELSVQAANDTNSASDRSALQKEVGQLKEELNRIADNTDFNGKKLLDGSFTAQKFQVGANANQTISVSVGSARGDAIGNQSLKTNTGAGTITEALGGGLVNNVTVQNLTVSGKQGSATVAVAAGASAKSIADAVNSETLNTGVSASARTTAKLSVDAGTAAGTVSFDLYGSNTGAGETVSAVITNPSDLTDLAKAINDHTGKTGVSAVLSEDKASVELVNEAGYDIAIDNFAHSNAAATDIMHVDGGSGTAVDLDGGGTTTQAAVGGEVSFSSASTYTVTTDGDTSLLASATNASSLSDVASIDITSQSGASDALKVIDGALASIDDNRANLGAVQNRFGSTISNLQNVSENLSSARSRIQDADFAKETAALTKGQILQQAGFSILSQANQSQQAVLSLLR
ncbi:MAG: flagellin [Gammaproteobacteria bacterium]